MAPGNGHKDFDDLTAFPVILTESIPLTGGAPPGTPVMPAGTAGGGLANQAQNAIRSVLGWNWKPGADPKGLLSALNQSFQAVPTEGRVDYKYRPRNYSLTVQADMGALTGAQASLNTRAVAVLDQMLTLIDRLTPLLPDPDLSDVESTRQLVRGEVSQIVGQFGVEGGPNVQMVDELFQLLGGKSWDPAADAVSVHAYEDIGGHLGDMRKRFGFTQDWVNTIDEEQDLTNFVVLVDWANTLYANWKANRVYFIEGTGRPQFMGTQLVQVARALAAVDATVTEVEYLFDTVYLGPDIRQVMEIKYADKTTIFLADLLSWVRTFATETGPQLINQSGKDGLEAFTTTVKRLCDMVELADPSNPAAQPDSPAFGYAGYRSARIRDALRALVKSLTLVHQEALQVRRYPAPRIKYAVAEGDWARMQVTLVGTGFRADGKMTLALTSGGRKLEAQSQPVIVSETEAWAAFALDGKVRDRIQVTFTNEDGQYAAADVNVEAMPDLGKPHIDYVFVDRKEHGLVLASLYGTALTDVEYVEAEIQAGPAASSAATPAAGAPAPKAVAASVNPDATGGDGGHLWAIFKTKKGDPLVSATKIKFTVVTKHGRDSKLWSA